ncbi:hypothetical protein ACFLVX_05115 [Chloroflexota bacterium]
MSAWATAIGAMLIPSAIVLLLEAPDDWPSEQIWTVSLMIGALGFVMIIIGLVKGLLDDKRTHKRENKREGRAIARERRELVAEERKEKEHVEYMAALSELGKRFGINPVILKMKIRREVDRHEDNKELEKDEKEMEDDSL